MTKSLDLQPWRGLSDDVAALIEPELDAIGAETLEAIAREVPEYARPLEGSFGRGIRTGVEEALRQFVSLIRDPESGRGFGREVYVSLGRGEFRQGRTLDSLQAAYRVGARVAWRRLSAAGRAAALDPETLSLLAEAIFAYIDELAADAVEGYAEAQSEVEDLARRRRNELAALLVREPPPAQAEVASAAEAVGWSMPRRAAILACAERDLGPIARRLPASSLAAQIDGTGAIVLADPTGPGRMAEISRAAGDRDCAIGPAGPPAELPDSWALALTALEAVRGGALTAEGRPIVAERHLAELILIREGALAARIEDRALAPLEPLTARARERMAETALAFVLHGGNSVAMAAELDVHPQTVRYRVAKLRELLGDALDDPDSRFELELALRARALSGAAAAAAS